MNKEEIRNLNFIKIKIFCMYKRLLRGERDKPLSSRKYMQNAYLIQNLYSKYAKNS